MSADRGRRVYGFERVLEPLPSLRDLTRWLRDLNEAWNHEIAGPGQAYLHYLADRKEWRVGVFLPDDEVWVSVGPEWIPADSGQKFDAVATARRLLAGARDAVADSQK